MSRFLAIGRNAEGEPSIWGHWQNLSAKKKAGAWPLAGRAWLNWPGNGLRVEWALFTRHFRISIDLASTAESAVSIGIALPFLFTLWVSLECCGWVLRLPGVKWLKGQHASGEREVSIEVHHGSIWWVLWRNPDYWEAEDWRHDSFDLVDFFLGRSEYFESHRRQHNIAIVLPEGEYGATCEIFTAIWLRPRWPWPRRVKRARVEIEGGIPVPGDGENDWDLDDDAIYSTTLPASTVEEVQIEIQTSIMKDRGYDSNWTPAAGWPAHCKR